MRRTKSKCCDKLLKATLALLASCSTGLAQAQSSTPQSAGVPVADPPQLSDPAVEAGEILVTARKQSEALSKVGLSITAASGEQLVDRGIDTVAELVKLEPSFQFSTSYANTPILTIRGIGYGDNSIQAPLAVSIYQDEIPHPYAVMSKGVNLDVERVEIVKGPQGTLYGQNSTGGAINFVANRPTDEFEAGGMFSFGSYNAVHLDGYVSGPLSESLKARVAASADLGGAWQRSYTRKDELGDKKAFFGRMLLDWQPLDNFSALLNINGWRDRSDSKAAQLSGLFISNPQNVGLGRGNRTPTRAQILAMPAYAAAFQQFILQPLAPRDANAADWIAGTDPSLDQSFAQASLRMDWEISSKLTLTSLTSYQNYSQNDDLDLGGARVLGVIRTTKGEIESFFQEFRARGEFGSSDGNWQLGANYSRDKSNEFGDQLSSASAGYLTGSPPSIGVNPPARSTKFYGNALTRTLAVYANLSVPLLESLTLNAGIRHTDVNSNFGGCTGTDDPQLEALVSFAFGDNIVRRGKCFTVLFSRGPSGYVRTELNETNTPWRVGLEWEATDEILVYALASKGFKAGLSPVLAATVAAQYRPITQESVLSYEAGIKSRLFDNSLTLNLNAFYYDHRDKQLVGRVVDPVFGTFSRLVNIPKSHVFGIEASFVARPVTGLTLDGAGTYLQTEVDSDFRNFDPYGTPISFQGQHFPYTPKWSLSGGARYDLKVTDRLGAFVSARASYQSQTVSGFGQANVLALGYPSLAIKAYTLLDASAGVITADGRWRFELFGRNLTDEYYWTSVNFNGDQTVRSAGMPRTFGLAIKYQY